MYYCEFLIYVCVLLQARNVAYGQAGGNATETNPETQDNLTVLIQITDPDVPETTQQINSLTTDTSENNTINETTEEFETNEKLYKGPGEAIHNETTINGNSSNKINETTIKSDNNTNVYNDTDETMQVLLDNRTNKTFVAFETSENATYIDKNIEPIESYETTESGNNKTNNNIDLNETTTNGLNENNGTIESENNNANPDSDTKTTEGGSDLSETSETETKEDDPTTQGNLVSLNSSTKNQTKNNVSCRKKTILHVNATTNLTFVNNNICFVLNQFPQELCKNVTAPSISAVFAQHCLVQIYIEHEIVPELFENSVADLPNLRKFTMMHNKLRRIAPGAFNDLNRLVLTISFNDLEEIEENVFTNLSGVVMLILHGNKIAKIHPNAFTNMTDLMLLDLSNNDLKEWDSNWLVGSPVRSIMMYSNLVQRLPENAFKYVKFSPERLENLDITFSHNELKNLTREMLEGLESVGSFYVNNNRIGSFGPDLFKNITIEEFGFENNSLTCIEKQRFNETLKAKVIYLQHNPWNETCRDDIEEWIASRHKTF